MPSFPLPNAVAPRTDLHDPQVQGEKAIIRS